MLSAARSLIFPSFIKKSTKSTKAHLQSQEYSFWLFLARLSDLYCGNVSKKRFLTSLNVKNFFFISKSFLFVAYTIAISVPNLQKPSPFSNYFIGWGTHLRIKNIHSSRCKCRTTHPVSIVSTISLRSSCTACNHYPRNPTYPK